MNPLEYCPFCKSSLKHHLFSDPEYNYMECTNCHNQFTQTINFDGFVKSIIFNSSKFRFEFHFPTNNIHIFQLPTPKLPKWKLIAVLPITQSYLSNIYSINYLESKISKLLPFL